MDKQNYGIKVAQPGYDVRNCADYQLLFNSSWPSIAIVIDETITVPADGVYTHNLKFVPLTMAWLISGGNSQGRIFPDVSSTKVYFDLSLVGEKVNIKIYNLDIQAEVDYPYLQAAQVAFPYDKTYGMKVVKENKSIASKDLRDFIFHSRCASPMVLAVKTEKHADPSTITLSTITYKYPQGYIPWVFGYAAYTIGGDLVYQWAPPSAQAPPATGSTITEATIRYFNTGAGSANMASLIVLRDPLFTGKSIEVFYP